MLLRILIDSANFFMLFLNEKFVLPEIYLDIEDKEEWKWYQPIYGQIHVGKVHLQQNISQLRT